MFQRLLMCMVVFGGGAGIVSADSESAVDPHTVYQHAAEQLAKQPAEARAGFRKAAELYEQLVQVGNANSRLFHNTGCAYLMAGEPGRATYYLRCAQRLQPGDHTTQAALTQLRRGLDTDASALFPKSPLPDLPVPPTMQLWIGLSAALVGWALLLWAWRGGRRVLVAFSLVLALVGSAVAGVVVWSVYQDQTAPWGVVIAQTATLREGHGEGFRPVLNRVLPPGAEFRTLHERDEWVQVQLANGSRGWLQRRDVMIAR